MVKLILRHPDLRLVGLHCYTPATIGRDVGEIVGIGPMGATGNVDDIVAAEPDCLMFQGFGSTSSFTGACWRPESTVRTAGRGPAGVHALAAVGPSGRHCGRRPCRARADRIPSCPRPF